MSAVSRSARSVAAAAFTRRCRPTRLQSSYSSQRYCSSCASSSPNSTRASSPPKTSEPPDHRTLGVRQKLFTTSIYSPGSPIFLPHGARIFNRLVKFLRDKYVRYGFEEVITPTIYKKALWAKSGHLENYAEDMFTVISMSPTRAAASAEATGTGTGNLNSDSEIAASEEDEYGLKPMNCPGHCLVFASEHRGYKNLPIRYADFSPLHRNEISGALSGLTRVRRFHQDDGHIFCRPSQVESEIRATLKFIGETYEQLRMGPYRLALSTRPEDHYIGSLSDWENAENALKRALDSSGQKWTINEGDGAFYGPKIDVILSDSDGKEHQTATIQLDFQMPKRFELEYQAPAPELEQRGETTSDPELLAVYGPVRPVMIHRAVLGSVERLMALLIEHYNGRWPFWLNPRQGIILTLNDTEPVLQWAQRTRDVLLGTVDAAAPSHLAIDVDDSARSLQAKLREAKSKGYGVIVVIGPRNVAKGSVTVDATGIPEMGDSKAERSTEMTPEELLHFMNVKVESYQ